MSTTPYLIPHSYHSNGPAREAWPAILQAWLPFLLFTLVFALESQACFGSDHTSQPLHRLFQSIFGDAINHSWSELHFLIRKAGHFMGYGILSLVCFRSLHLTLRERASGIRLQRMAHTLAIFATLLVASADEIHQCFLPNRSGSIHDVLLDCSGAVTLQFVLFLALQFRSAQHQSVGLNSVPQTA